MTITKIPCIDPNIEVVCHLSDIHIRLRNRYEEYEYVFEQLYSILENEQARAVVVITGDILHSKNELSPDCIVQSRNFLTRLASIFPCFYIMGNHDCLLNNKDVHDSLSALFQDMPKDLYYLKDSGVYEYGNLRWYVHSLWDDGFIPLDLQKLPFEGGFKIGLYHGGVGKFYVGNHRMEMVGEKKLVDFEAYDFTFLGDIHQMQFLNGTTAYAGSLICQNFGETETVHGFLRWHLENATASHVPLYNPWSCVCVAYHGNGRLTCGGSDNLGHFPSKGHVRVSLLEEDLEWKPLWKTLQQKYPDCRWTVKRQEVDNARVRAEASEELLQVHEDQPSSFRESLQKRFTIPSDISKEVFRLLDPCCGKISAFRTKQDRKLWTIERVEFDFLFGYGEKNEINFCDLDSGVIGAFGKNSSGKSTLLDILCLMLWNRITRFSHGNSIPKEVIHTREEKARGTIHIRTMEGLFVIEKEFYREGSKVKVKENIYEVSSSERKKRTMEQRRKTSRFLEQMIGTWENFMMLSGVAQNCPLKTEFQSMTQKERKEFLGMHLGLQEIEEYRQKISDELKSYKVQKDHLLKESYHGTPLLHCDESAFKNSLQSLEDELSEYETKIRLTENDIVVQQRDYGALHFFNSSYARGVMDGRRTKELQNDIQKRLDKISKEISNIQALVSDDAMNEATADAQRECQSNISALSKDLVESFRSLSIAQKEIQPRESPVVWTEQFWSKHLSPQDWSNPEFSEWKKQKYASVMRTEELVYSAEEEEALRGAITTLKAQLDHSLLEQQNLESPQKWSAVLTTTQRCLLEHERQKSELEKAIRLLDEKISNDFFRSSKKKYSGYTTQKAVLDREFETLSSRLEKHQHILYNPQCDACQRNPLKQEKDELQVRLKQISQERLEIEEGCQDLLQVWNTKQSLEDLEDEWKKSVQDKKISLGNVITELSALQQKEKEALEELHQLELWKEHNERKERLQDQQKRLARVQRARVYELSRMFLPAYEEYCRHYDMECTRNQEVQQTIHYFEEHIHNLERSKLDLEKKLERLQQREKLEHRIVSLGQEKDALQHDLKEISRKHLLDEKIQELGATKAQLLEAKCSILQKKVELEVVQERRRTLMQEYTSVQREIRVYDCAVQILHRDGLSLELLRFIVPVLTEHMNAILAPFLGNGRYVSIQVRDDEKSISFEMLDRTAKSVHYYGGMESFLLDVAFKIVLAELSTFPQCSLFFIDEGVSVLDQDRIQNVSTLLEFIQGHFRHVMLISHIPLIHDFVDKKIYCYENSTGYRSLA